MPNNQFLRKQWESVSRSGSESVRIRILTSIFKKIENRKFNTLLLKISGTVVAATVLLIAGIIIGRINRSSIMEKRLTTWIVANDGVQLLPDGTKVWMGGESRLKFNDSFAASREIWLSGNASFDVSHKKDNREFLINTKAGTIRVKGTSFSVRQSEANKISITLYEGDLDFISLNNKKLVINLDPSDHFVFDTESQKYDISEFFKNISWQDGKYRLEDTDLKQLIAFIQWKYDTAINLEPGVKDNIQKISGTISHNESLESIIDKLCYSLKLQYKKENKSYRLSKSYNNNN